MNNKPIYVELAMKTDITKLWERTQNPELHKQWDLRFSEIVYLPRQEKDGPIQRFQYQTRIGFGLAITGMGETKGTLEASDGQRMSTLSFTSEQPLSLIHKGGGYWKYKPKGDEAVTFSTQFHYQTRFGLLGKLFDRFLFRPLFGYATAWSFDMLRIWLEKEIAPAISMQRAFMHYLTVAALVMIWLYQGIVPKLIYPEQGDKQLLLQAGWFPGWETVMGYGMGMMEIAFACILVLSHRSRWIYTLQAILLLVLGITALAGVPDLAKAPFNPFTLNLAMLALGGIAATTTSNLPNARRCLRRPASP